MHAKAFAEKLKQAGLNVLSFIESDYDCDGEVRLEHNIVVQVNMDYTMLNTYQYKDGQLVSVTHVKENPSIEYIVQYVTKIKATS